MLGSIGRSAGYVIPTEQACTRRHARRDRRRAASKDRRDRHGRAAAARIASGSASRRLRSRSSTFPPQRDDAVRGMTGKALGDRAAPQDGRNPGRSLLRARVELDPTFSAGGGAARRHLTPTARLDQARKYHQRAFARSESLRSGAPLHQVALPTYIVTGTKEEVVATPYRPVGGTIRTNGCRTTTCRPPPRACLSRRRDRTNSRRAVMMWKDGARIWCDSGQQLTRSDAGRFGSMETKEVLRTSPREGSIPG